MLSSIDNVAAVLSTARRQAVVSVASGSGELVKALNSLNEIPFGHKIATQPIGRGEKIIRYGYAIGAATRDIAEGEHVHTHNMRSLLTQSLKMKA